MWIRIQYIVKNLCGAKNLILSVSGLFCIIIYFLRLLADYINPTVYDFWSKMSKANLLELGKKGAPLVVTGDGQELVSPFFNAKKQIIGYTLYNIHYTENLSI